jgi:hypothetical protein
VLDDSLYEIPFDLRGVPIVNKFVARNDELRKIEAALLPGPTGDMRRKVFTLFGLGGIGKTQLAVEFARMHKKAFSAIFWLDGSSRSQVEQSIAATARRLPSTHIPEANRLVSSSSSTNIDVVIQETLKWLSRPANGKWLLVFDNVDRDDSTRPGDPDAFNPENYFPGADQGSILITTRLSRLQQLGGYLKLSRMSGEQSKNVLELRAGKSFSGKTQSLIGEEFADTDRLKADNPALGRIASCHCSSRGFHGANKHKCQ